MNRHAEIKNTYKNLDGDATFYNGVFTTMLMICTEEKWLKSLYGREYKGYCRKVNRCIPWLPENRR